MEVGKPRLDMTDGFGRLQSICTREAAANGRNNFDI